MSRFHRTITLLLILSFLVGDVAPVVAATERLSRALNTANESIPPFPEDAQRTLIDWSLIDWDRKVTLPEEEHQYSVRFQELARKNDYSALSLLKRSEESMSSDRILTAYQVPLDVQDLVRKYRSDLHAILSNEEKLERKRFLNSDIKKLLEDTERIPEELNKEILAEISSSTPVIKRHVLPIETVVTTSTRAKSVDVSMYAPVNLSNTQALLANPVEVVPDKNTQKVEVRATTIIPRTTKLNPIENVTTDSLLKQHLLMPIRTSNLLLFDHHSQATRISEMLWSVLGVDDAHAGATFVDTSVNTPFDRALLYISEQQQEDGGLSGSDRYMTTAQAVLVLAEAHKTDNDQYRAMVNYLQAARVETVRELAMKARIVFALQDDSYKKILDEILAQQQEDGGFGLTEYYQSDAITSLEVAWALWATQYYKKDPQPLVKALIYSAQLVDANGAVRFSPNGRPSHYLTAKMLQYFVLFDSLQLSAITENGNQLDVSMHDKITMMLSYLKGSVDPVTGALLDSQEASDLVQVLRAFQLYDFELGMQKVIEKRLLVSQLSSGSFDESIQATVAALAVLAKPDFEISLLTPVGGLTEGQSGIFNIEVKNVGTKRGALKQISSFVDDVLYVGDTPITHTVIFPGESLVVQYSMPLSTAFTGQSKFEFFVEGAELESRTENNWKSETYTVVDLQDRPALPRYFVTQKWQLSYEEDPKSPSHLIPKGVSIPAFMINYRKKVDPKRKNIVVLYRPKGVTEVARDWDGTPIEWYQTGIPEKYYGFFLAYFEEPYLPEDAEYEVTVGVVGLNGKVYIQKNNVTIIKLTSDEKKYLGAVSGALTVGSDPAQGVKVHGNGIDHEVDEQGKFSVSLPNGSTGVWADRISTPWLDELVTVAPIPLGGETKNVRVYSRVKQDTTPPVVEKPFVQPPFPDTIIRSDRAVTLVVRASDVVYVKNATFWYWNPTQKVWNHVATEDAPFNRDNIAIDFMVKWNIPGEMFGTGFKIKAVVEDYNGNISQTIESDEFEIHDGVPPKDVTPPVLENLQVRYMQGDTIKNQQEAILVAPGSDNDRITNGDFWYWDPKKSDWILIGQSNDPSPIQSLRWVIPKEMLGQGYRVKAVVYDATGNASESKEFGPFEIIDGSMPGGVVSVNDLSNGQWLLGEKKTISWQFSGTYPVNRIDSVTLYYNLGPNFHADTIGSAIDVSKMKTLDYIMYADAAREGAAKIRISFCNTVWNCTTIDSEPFTIVDPSPPRQYPWNKEQSIDFLNVGGSLYRAIVAAFDNADNSREFVYIEYEMTTDGTQHRRIIYRKLLDGTWQDPIPLTQDSYRSSDERILIENVHAIKGPRGEIHVDFARTHTSGDWQHENDGYEVFYLRLESGVVQDRQQISSDNTPSSAQHLAIDSRGNIVVVWHEGLSSVTRSGLRVAKSRTNINGVWTTEQTLTNTVTTDVVAVTIDHDQPVIMYNQNGDYIVRRLDSAWRFWSKPVPITPRQVPKSAFPEAHIECAGCWPDMSTIVDRDPSNPEMYLWKSSIKTRHDLEVKLQGITSIQTFLDIWSANQYATDEGGQLLLTPSQGVYDLFTMKGGKQQQWRYSLRHMRMQPNFDTQDAGIQKDQEIIGTEGATEDVRGFKVLLDSKGLYSVFYTKTIYSTSRQMTHPYHFYFDGEQQWYHAMVASPLRNVSDNVSAVTERGNVISYYYTNGRYVNTADYNGIIKYRLSLLSPSNKEKLLGSDAKVSWSFLGGDVDTYTVLVGKNVNELKAAVESIKGYEAVIKGLEGSTTYYWQVLGQKSNTTITSAIREFTTPAAVAKMSIEDENGPLDMANTISFQPVVVGKTSEHTITIRNNGNIPLTLGGGKDILFEGVDSKDFLVYKQPDQVVEAGKTTTATVVFRPLSKGIKNAELVISTNDPEKKEVRLKVSSVATSPALTISVNNTDVAISDVFDLGEIQVGSTVDTVITIKNSGDADLALLKSQSLIPGEEDSDSTLSYVQFSGVGSVNVRVLKDPVSPIIPGAEASFTVRMEPKKSGDSSFGVSFYHNDKKISNPAVIKFSAVAVKSSLELFAGLKNDPIVGGDTITVGEISAGSSTSTQFRIKNTGTAPLIITSGPVLTILEGESSDFSIQSTLTTYTLQPGDHDDFVVKVSPKRKGPKRARITFATNDPNNPEVVITISASAAEANLDVLSGESSLKIPGSIWKMVTLDSIPLGKSGDVALTVSNTGTIPLNITDSISITQNEDEQIISIIQKPGVVIPGGGTSTLILRATPKIHGKQNASITLFTNDLDEGRVTIPISYTATAPDLRVLFNANEISTVAPLNKIDLGGLSLGEKTPITITITNDGDADLVFKQGGGIVLSENESGSYTLDKPSLDPIKPGEQREITLNITPLSLDSHSVNLIIETNDPDEKYTAIALHCKGITPILTLTYDGKEISQNEVFHLSDIFVGSSIEAEFQIANSGSKDLLLTGKQLVALYDDAAEFNVDQPDRTTIKPGEKTSFKVHFTPNSLGEKKAKLSIESTNHTEKAIVINLVSVARDPEIDVLYDDAFISSDGSIILGDTGLGVALIRTFTVKNSGNAPLLLAGQKPFAVMEGQNTQLFTISSAALNASVINPGESIVFSVSFENTIRGDYPVALAIKSNDRDESLFRVALTAGAHDPKMSVTKDTVTLDSNADVGFEDAEVSTHREYVVTISNVGDRDLVLDGVAPFANISGADASQFSIDSKLPGILKQGERATIGVSFTPTTKGVKRATLTIKSNDRDTSVFNLILQGRATASELSVETDGKSLISGDSIDLGYVRVGTPRDLTVVLKNSGDANLLISGNPQIQVSGDNVADVSIIKEPHTPLKPGESTVLTIRFISTSVGVKSAHISFITNDYRLGLFSVVLSADAREPVLAITDANSQPVRSGVPVQFIRNEIETESELALTVHNSGNDDLTFSRFAFEGDDMKKFRISSRPSDILKAHSTSTLAVIFRSDDPGMKNTTLVVESDDREYPVFSIPLSAEAFVREGVGSGLTAEYFATKNLSGLVVRKTESHIDFDWQNSAPSADLPSNDFSVRWSGTIEAPMSGLYDFITRADDGVRLWVNGVKVVDDWAEHAVTEKMGSVQMQRGKKYDVTLEYFDGIGAAIAQLSWKKPDGTKEVIPASQLYPNGVPDISPIAPGSGVGLTGEYFADTAGSDLIIRRKDQTVNFNWKEATPDPDIPVDGFSVRWYGYVEPRYSGEYTITVKTDDGVRVWMDGKKIIDDWNARPTKENSALISMQAGEKHKITMSYYEESGGARAHLYWTTPFGVREIIPQTQLYPMDVPDKALRPVGSGTGLAAEYFSGIFEKLVLSRIDPQIDFKWNYDAPESHVPANNFSTRWKGKLEPRATGLYQFASKSDDGIRVTINGASIINDWSAAGLRTSYGSLTLEEGKKYDISIEYFDATGYATARLYWKTPYGKAEIIPQTQLYQ
ncbi:MAG: choice-of-anchor D domain-containing protein [bacterium]|nr:choice-of-anchor D domain-containing protein [bacterium]